MQIDKNDNTIRQLIDVVNLKGIEARAFSRDLYLTYGHFPYVSF